MITSILSIAPLTLLLAAIIVPAAHSAPLVSTGDLAPAAPAPPVNSLGLYFDLTFITFEYSLGSTGYRATPTLRSFPNGQPTATTVASPSFGSPGTGFQSELPAGQTFSTSGSSIYPAFNPYKAELNSSGWTLTTGTDTATPTLYTFDVNASALGEFGAIPARIGAGFQGATFMNGASPNFTFTGPASFDSVVLNLFNFTESGQDQDSGFLSAGITSHTFGNPLGNGDYFLVISYFKDFSGSVTTTTPTGAGNNLLPNWGGVVGARTVVQDYVTFNVVPEPSVSLLLAGALGMFASKRRGGGAIAARKG